MYNYGIRGVAYKWFVSYMSNRKHYPFMKDVISDTSDVHHGVPQGSVLGSLLFLIYVNDIARALPGEKLKLFADDTNLFICGINKTAINNKCNLHHGVPQEPCFLFGNFE